MRLLALLLGGLSLRAARRVGAFFGALLWLARIRRRVALENLQRALDIDASDARRLLYQVYRQLGCAAVEFFRIPRLSGDDARQLLGDDSLARLEALRREGNGVLVLSAHLGNWDLLACAAARAGLPVNVITRTIKRRGINDYWMRTRGSCGVQLLEAAGSARRIVAALRRNELVAVVLDQHDPDGVAVPFFGRLAATSASLARLARLSGAPVLPAFLVRTDDGFRLELGEALDVSRADDDIELATARFTAAIEQAVREHPEQWLWLHRRWKLPEP
ncbi:MAG: lysophospholipid acyltransferase family protein [Myxococcales bacterium]|nr:lysophospholipid acyltransferase family protein [Myxococcales bacterium]